MKEHKRSVVRSILLSFTFGMWSKPGNQLSRGGETWWLKVWEGITSLVPTPHTVFTSSKGGKILAAPPPTLPASNEAQLNYRAPDTPLERQCLPRVLPHSPGLVTDFFAWRAAEKEGEKTNFTSLNTHYLINVVTSSNNILKVGLSTCSTQGILPRGYIKCSYSLWRHLWLSLDSSVKCAPSWETRIND